MAPRLRFAEPDGKQGSDTVRTGFENDGSEWEQLRQPKSLASISLGGRINDEGSGNEDGAKGVDLGDTVPGRAQKASGPHPAWGEELNGLGAFPPYPLPE